MSDSAGEAVVHCRMLRLPLDALLYTLRVHLFVSNSAARVLIKVRGRCAKRIMKPGCAIRAMQGSRRVEHAFILQIRWPTLMRMRSIHGEGPRWAHAASVLSAWRRRRRVER